MLEKVLIMYSIKNSGCCKNLMTSQYKDNKLKSPNINKCECTLASAIRSHRPRVLCKVLEEGLQYIQPTRNVSWLISLIDIHMGSWCGYPYKSNKQVILLREGVLPKNHFILNYNATRQQNVATVVAV